MKLNKNSVSQIEVPAGKTEIIVFDESIPQFGLRVRAGGSRNWIFQYRQGGKQRRISFGSATTVSLQQARERASLLHAQVKLGSDPAGAKIESRVRARETFEHILRPYLTYKKAQLRPRSYIQIERHLLKHTRRLHGLQLAKIDRRTLAALLSELATNSGPTEANNTRASLSTFFAWAIREGLTESNPVIGTNQAVEKGPRDRVLGASELRTIWSALADDDHGTIVKLLALTGQRRDEIGGLRRQEIDLDKATISLPAERTKNNKPHIIPLSPTAVDILQAWLQRSDKPDHIFGRAGFRGWSTAKILLDRRILATGTAIPNWTLHDLRRTFSTVAHDELEIPPHVVEAVLNHVSGHRAGVAGVYNKAIYAKEKAVALARWAEHLTAIVNGTDSKIVALPTQRGGR